MLPKDFPYNDFLKMKEKKNKLFSSFVNGEKWFIPVMQRPCRALHWGAMCKDKDKSLESQLDVLADYIEMESDFIYSYLEPWNGVGIFASAFGCPFILSEHDAPQTLPIYKSLEEVRNFKKPDIRNCEAMRMVLEKIRYFREKTGDMLEISLTDTQSPNDNASLIMDACEFFIESISEPEALHPLLQEITDLMIRFTQMQIEAAGKTMIYPGHIMVSAQGLKGISIADDNLAVVSPKAYENSSLPYNNMLSRHFGGLAIHSCGNFVKNIELLKKTEGLTMVDCAIGPSSDPTPNDPKKLKEAFLDTGVILKVRLGSDELGLLEGLIDKRLKVIVEIDGDGTIEEKNRTYLSVKEKMLELEKNA